MIERDSFLQTDRNKNFKKNNNMMMTGMERHTFLEPGSSIGEITGENLELGELEQGMPLRFQYNPTEKNEIPNDYNPTPNHLDFDLFDQKPKQEISYFDPANTKGAVFADILNQDKKEIKKEVKFDSISNTFNWFILSTFQNMVNNKSNISVSPYTLLNALMTIYRGSTGKTESELENYLQLPKKTIAFNQLMTNNKSIYKSGSFKMVNFIYLASNLPINKAFQNYVSSVAVIDKINLMNPIGETRRINNYVSKITNGAIVDAVATQMINPYTKMLVVNCLFFRSRWKYRFNPNYTRKSQFFGTNQKVVELMLQNNVSHYYCEDQYNQVIEMAYEDPNFVMGIILPKDLNMPTCTDEQFDNYFKSFRREKIEVLKIPKFIGRSKFRVDNIFKRMGIKTLFKSAKLDDITNGDIEVSDMIHQCVTIVDETGIKNPSPQSRNLTNKRSINFVANKPFIYYIRHLPTSTIVLSGSQS
tara:strand:+ start:130 stop:1551 length:1422 start_codon:yes stop_codon:yes gene_type:complete